MSDLELILREIDDPHTRENFFRLLQYVKDEPILQGNWKLHELYLKDAVTNFKFAHNHKFVPTDIILLSVIGDRNVQFNYDKFTKTNLDITASGAVKIRFLSGSYRERLSPTTESLTDVPLGTGAVGPPGPPGPDPNCDCTEGNVTVTSSSSVEVDSIDLADFKHARYSCNVRDVSDTITKSFHMNVHQKADTSIREVVYGKFGDSIDYEVATSISAGSCKITVTNNEAFDIQFRFQRYEMN